MGRLRVLLIGEERDGDLMPMYRAILSERGAEVHTFDQGAVTVRLARHLAARAIWRVSYLPFALLINQQLRRCIRDLGRVDLTLACDSKYLFRSTVRRLKRRLGGPVVTWQTGDLQSPTMSSRFATAALPEYDCVFAHARFDVEAAVRLGARRTEYLPLGCNPELFTAIRDDEPAPDSDVVFVGHWRPEREAFLERLVEQGVDYSLAVWGFGWRVGRRPKPASPLHPYVRYQPTTWTGMSDTIRRSKIAISFLTYFDTGRCVAPLRLFEIPAIGAFTLTERGRGEALEFFDEGREIACFTDACDLKEKITHYLRHDDERRWIQRAGQHRVLKSGYLASERLSHLVAVSLQR